MRSTGFAIATCLTSAPRTLFVTALKKPVMPVLVIFGTVSISSAASAAEPLGWIGNDHTSAYTLGAGEIELSGGLSRVNDTIDFLDLREDILGGNSRLIDNSGDLEGTRNEVRVGIWRGLELYYQRHDFDLTLKTRTSARVDIIDLSEQLSTEQTSWGAKFVLYENRPGNKAMGGSSFAIDVRRTENESRDFDGYIETFRLNDNFSATFNPPQRFAMDNLSDEGWQARLLYSTDLSNSVQASIWAGYGESESTSGTSTEIEFPSIAEQFEQSFFIEETQYMAGASINLQGIPRMPIQLGYEYIKINKRDAVINSSNSTLIPSFLRGGNILGSADTNHTAYGTVSWWITPHLYTSLSGKLFKNQFVGVTPHYNNPLSASFSDTTYGYLSLSIGVKLTRAAP